jgi:sugar (pentulose or hexulose) kinase
VIIPATHDTASAIAGMPIKGDEKWAFISLGTWCISGIETNQPIINDAVFNSGFGNEGGVEGKNMLIKNTTGLWIIQKCREGWIKDENQNIEWCDIDKEILSSGPCDSYIDVDDERFGKDQSYMANVVANYCKETGQKIPADKGEVAKVVYQSLVMKLKKNIDHIEQMTGDRIEELHLVGGGTKAKFLCQWIANCIGLPIIAGPTETTSVGNLLFQLKADGQIKNMAEGRDLCYNSYDTDYYVPENQQEWQEKYKKYKSIIISGA